MESDRRPDHPPSEPAADEASAGPFRPGPLRTAALLSGVTALVAQTVWVRALGRAVGTTTEALAAVAAVFLGGLGLGAALGGRLAARTSDPARAAGRCLLGAAVLVLVSPWLFELLPGLHLFVLGLLGQEPGPSPWPALLVGLPLLLVPTVLMGATFPLLLAARRSAAEHVGRGTGGLYALNTLGAALGTLVTVVALMALGERLALTAAAGLEILAGAALLVGGSRAAQPNPAGPGEAVRAQAAPGHPPTPPGLKVALTLTGFVGLGVEVAAFRLLEPITGPHLWGVSLLLVPVLLGIALGGWIGGVVADRSRAPARTLTSTLALAGALVAASLWVAGLLPWLLFAGDATTGAARLLGLAAGTALVLLPPLTALGATFPLAVRAAAARGTAPARASGDLTAWNALGAVAGSLCVGFVALPAVGAATTLITLAWILPAGGALLRLVSPGRGQALPALATALPLLLLALPFVQGPLLASAPALPEIVALNRRNATPDAAGRPPGLPRLSNPADVRLNAEWFGGRPVKVGGEPFAPREGRLGSVALLEEPSGSIRLRVNALSEARFVPDQPAAGSTTEVALGLLPALAHPAPKRALVIGHGAGWTVESVLAADVGWVDVAELDETLLDVVEAWRAAGAGAGADGKVRRLAVRTDPRAHLKLTDGRLLLRRAAADPALRYDVIASQPSHPWVPGAGHLFTREAYALAHGALTEDGVFAQWLNLFEMSEDLLRSSLATFRDVFPTCWLFLFQREAVLLGFVGEPRIDTVRWERLMEAGGPVRAVGEPAGIRTPGDLWSRVTLDGAGIERLAPAATTRLVVDDRPALELGLAWRVLQNASDEDLEAFLRREFPPDLARLVPDRVVRDRWTALAIDSLLTAGQVPVALLWDEKMPWGTDPTSRIVRAAVARARGELPRAETILHGVVAGLVLGGDGLEEHGDWVSGWIGLLAETAREAPALRHQLVEDAAGVARLLPKDGRVRAAMAYLRESANDLEGARAEYAEALAAKDPAAPPGTAGALARLVLTMSGRSAAPTGEPAPSLADDTYMLDLLRTDPGTWGDRSALDLLARLETRVGSAIEADRAEVALQAMDEKEAVAAFRAAWGFLPEGRGNGLEEAQRAVIRAPNWVDAWELLALLTLQRHALAEAPEEKAFHRRTALFALGRAWESAKDHAAEERRARAILRWYRVDDADLVPLKAE